MDEETLKSTWEEQRNLSEEVKFELRVGRNRNSSQTRGQKGISWERKQPLTRCMGKRPVRSGSCRRGGCFVPIRRRIYVSRSHLVWKCVESWLLVNENLVLFANQFLRPSWPGRDFSEGWSNYRAFGRREENLWWVNLDRIALFGDEFDYIVVMFKNIVYKGLKFWLQWKIPNTNYLKLKWEFMDYGAKINVGVIS